MTPVLVEVQIAAQYKKVGYFAARLEIEKFLIMTGWFTYTYLRLFFKVAILQI